MGAAGTGQQPHCGFRQGHLGLGFGNTDIAGQGTFQPAPHGIAVDGGNGHTPELAQGFEGLPEQAGHFAGVGFVAVGKKFQVRTGGEELLPLAGNHQRINIRVGIELLHQVFQSGQALCVPGVGRWIADGDQGRVVDEFQGQFVCCGLH